VSGTGVRDDVTLTQTAGKQAFTAPLAGSPEPLVGAITSDARATIAPSNAGGASATTTTRRREAPSDK
jgi:hypothetical protein